MNKIQSPSKTFLLLVMAGATLLGSSAASAADGTWTNLGGGSWNNTVNWYNATIAESSGGTAAFTNVSLAANATVTLDGARTIGNLIFDDLSATKYSWLINSGSPDPSTLTLAGTPLLTVSNGVTAIINAPLAGTAGLTKAGSGLLTLAGGVGYTGNSTVNNGVLKIQTLPSPTAPSTIPVTTGLRAQFDASAITGLSDGALVSTWNDISGVGNSATRNGSSAAGYPQYKVNVLNGKPVVRFSANRDSWFTFTRMTDIRTVFWVCKQLAVQGSAANFHFLLGDSSATDFHRSATGDQIWYSGAPLVLGGTTKLNGAVVNGGTTLLGTTWNLLDVVTSGAATASTISQDRAIAGRNWDGDIAEILIYNVALDSTQVAQVEAYLKAKWEVGSTIVLGSDVSIASGATLELSPLGGGASMTSGRTFSGSGNVVKSGSGNLAITAIAVNNTYAGGTVVSNGNVDITGANNGYSVLGKGTNQINSGASVTAWTDNTLGQHTAGVPTGTAPLFINGGTFYSGAYNHINRVTMNGGTLGIRSGVGQADGMDVDTEGANTPLFTSQANANTATISSKLTLRATTVFDVADGGAAIDLLFSGSSAGAGGLTKSGLGTMRLTANAGYAGATTVNQGVLSLGGGGGGAGTLPSGSTVTVASGATLRIDTGDATGYTATGPLNISGTLLKGGGTFHDTLRRPTYLSGGSISSVDVLDAAPFNIFGATISTVAGSGTSTISIPAGGFVQLRLNGSTYPSFSLGANSTLAVNAVLANYDGGGDPLNISGSGTMILNSNNTYTGNTTISGGTLQIGNGGTAGSVLGTITDNGALVFNRSDAYSFGGQISGSGSVTQAGPGTLTLTAATNSYSGPTVVSGGKLFVNGSLNLASSISVSNGATLGGTGSNGLATVASGGLVEGGQNGSGTLSLTNLIFSGTGTANVTVAVGGRPINVTALNGLNPSATAGSVTINASSLGVPPEGQYVLIDYAGTIGGAAFSAFQLGAKPTGPPRGNIGLLVDNVANSSVDLSLTNFYPIWTGAGGSEWSVNALPTKNWKLNMDGNPTDYMEGDLVVFDDTATTFTADVSVANVLPYNMTFNLTNTSFTLQGTKAIAGTARLVKNGLGLLTINSSNAFSGGSLLTGGNLVAGVDYALGTGTLTISGGSLTPSGTRVLANSVTANGDFGIGGTSSDSLTLNGAMSLGSGTRAVTVTNAGSTTFGGVISSGGLTKNGNGTLILNKDDTYTGGTIVNGGVLQLSAPYPGNGVGNINGNLTINSGATVYSTTDHTFGWGGGTLSLTNLNIIGGSLVMSNTIGQHFWNMPVNMTGGTITLGENAQFGGPAGGANTKVFVNSSPVTSVITGPGYINLRENLNGNALEFNVASDASNGTNLVVGVRIAGAAAGYGLLKSGSGMMMLTSNSTYTGNTTISGGTLQIGNGGADGSIVGNITNNAALVFNRNGAFSLGGVIAGSGSITQAGPGVVTLSGTSTYTGTTIVKGGTLLGGVGGSCSNTAVSVAGTAGNTALFGVSVTDNTKQWTCSSLTVNNAGGSSGLQFNFGLLTPSTTIAPLNVTGAVTFATAPSIIIGSGNLPATAGNGYPLMTWGLGSAPSLAGVTLTMAWPRNVATLSIVGNTLYLQITGNTEPLSWMGGNGVWDVNNSGNIAWKDSAAATTYYQESLTNDWVVFDNTVGTGGSIILNTNVAPVSVTVANPSADYTISGNGAIAGGTGLNKSGAGKLTMATTNTYTGITVYGGGIVSIPLLANGGTACSIGRAANAAGNQVFNGGILQYTGGTASSDRGFTFNSGGGSFDVTNSGTILTISGILGGTGGLTKSGLGTLGLANTANNYSGGTIVNGGVLQINNSGNGAQSSLPPGQLVTINSGGTVRLAVGDAIGWYAGNPGMVTINGGTFTVAPAIHCSVGNGGFTLNGGTITSEGAGDATGNYIFDGNVTTLANVNPSVISAAQVYLRLNPITFNVAEGAADTDLLITSTLVAGAAINKIGNGTLALTKGTHTIGSLANTAGVLQFGTNNADYLRLDAPIANSASILVTNSGTGGNAVDLNSSISGEGKLTKRGSGDLRIGTFGTAPASTYSGDTIVEAGQISVQGASGTRVFNSTSSLTVNNGARFGFDGAAAMSSTAAMTFGSFNGAGTVGEGFGSSHYLTLGNGNKSGSFSGDIGGTIIITKIGTGTQVFNGANSYVGSTTVSNGTLALGAFGSISNCPLITVVSNSIFDVSLVGGGFALNTNQMLACFGVVTGSVTVASNGLVVPGTDGTVATATITNGGLTFNAGSRVKFDLANATDVGGGVNDLLMVNGDLNLSNKVTVTFNFLGGQKPAAGYYTILKYSGALTGGAANLTSPDHVVFDDSVLHEIRVTFVSSNLVWRGDGVANNWDAATSSNWFNGASLDMFWNTDSVLFDDTGSNSPAVNLTTTVYPVSLTVSNVSKDYTFSGAGSIIGGVGLSKSGAGKLTLVTTNTYSGNTTIAAGTLQLGDGIANNGSVQGNITNNAMLIFANAGAQTFIGAISGTGSLTKSGLGNLSLAPTGDNTYPGGTLVSAGNIDIAGHNNGNSVLGKGMIQINSGASVTAWTHNALGQHPSITSHLFINGGTFNSDAYNHINRITMNGGLLGIRSGVSQVDGMDIGLEGGINPLVTIQANSGTATISSKLTLNAPTTFNVADGAATPDLLVSGVIVGGSSLIKSGEGAMVLAGVSTYTGATTVGAGAFALGASASISNSPSIAVAAGAFFDVSAVNGGFNLNTSQILSGSGTALGRVTANNNSQLLPGGGGLAGTLTFTSDLTFNAGSKVSFDLAPATTEGGGINDLINVGGDLVLNGPVTITINPNPALMSGTYRLFNYTNNLVGSTNNLVLGIVPNTRYTFTIDASTPKQINLIVAGGLGSSLVWRGLPTADWNLIGTFSNWFNGTGPDVFYSMDPVLFNDTRLSLAAVNLTASLLPSAIVVDSTNSYVLSGLGKLTGPAGVTKRGVGMLTLSTTNDFTGSINVEGGILKEGTFGALGNSSGITVSSGAQVDINGVYDNTHAYTFTLAGAGPGGDGALKNSGGDLVWVGLRSLNLTADAVINLAGRIDVGRALNVAGGVINGNGHRLTKNGVANMPIHATVANLAELIVNNGLVYGESTDYSLGTNVTVNAPGRVGAYAGRINNCAITLNSATLENAGGAAITWLGPLTLNGACTVNTFGPYNGGLSQDVIYSGPIGGTGSLTKINGSSLVLGGTNTYTGDTVISGGTIRLLATGSISNSANINVGSGGVLDVAALGTFGLASNQTLLGSGTVLGAVTMTNDTLLLPGATNSVGTLNLNSNLTLAGGRLVFDLGAVTNAGGADNDLLNVGGKLVLSKPTVIKLDFVLGQLDLVNPYTLINYAGALEGDTANLTVPSDTRYTFALDFSVTGKVLLRASGGPVPLTWYGGDDSFANWDEQATPAWYGQVFYQGDQVRFDSGANSKTVILVGALQPGSVYVKAENEDYTFGGDGRLTGRTGLTKDDDWSLILANTGSNDYTGPTVINGGTLRIGDGGTAGNLPATTLVTNHSALVFNRSDTVTVGNTIVGNGSLVQQGSGTLILSGPATFLGITRVDNGTLAGAGTLVGPVQVQAGGRLAPGPGFGTLTINNTLTLAGQTSMEISKSGATLTSDLIRGVSTLTYGGTLTVTASGDALAAGDTFTLFTATSYAEAFTTYNLPALGAGLGWDTSRLAIDGSIRVSQVYPVTCQVELEGFDGPLRNGTGQRVVTFTATAAGGAVLGNWTQELSFTNRVASYSLPSVLTNAVNLSAKTAWSLRKQLPVSLSGGPAVVNFTDLNLLLAGDLNGSNKVDLDDYYQLAAAWYQGDAAADIDGSGTVDLDDYFLLSNRWEQQGEPQ